MQRPELRASPQVAAVACLGEERRRARAILPDTETAEIQDAKPGAALGSSLVASVSEQRGGACRVALHSAAALIGDTEARASLRHATAAGALEQRGGTRLVLQHVFAILQPGGELVAGRGVSVIA